MEPTVPPSLPSTTTRSASAADEDLIGRAKAGDEAAWEVIFNQHYAPIFRFLRGRVASAEQAEDLAANVFMQAFRSIQRFGWQGKPFAAWLFGIARHELAAYYRSRKVFEQLDDQHQTPAQDEFLGIEITDILARLPGEYQGALELRFVMGLSGIEAAAAMGRSHGSFRSLLRRASLAFRAESNLSASGGPPDIGSGCCRPHKPVAQYRSRYAAPASRRREGRPDTATRTTPSLAQDAPSATRPMTNSTTGPSHRPPRGHDADCHFESLARTETLGNGRSRSS